MINRYAYAIVMLTLEMQRTDDREVVDSRQFHLHATTLGKLFTHVLLSSSGVIWPPQGDDVL